MGRPLHGAKLPRKSGFPFGNTPLYIGFPKHFLGFRKSRANTVMDITLKQYVSMLLFTLCMAYDLPPDLPSERELSNGMQHAYVHTILPGFPVGNPGPNCGFPSPFLGVSETQVKCIPA